MRAETQAPQVDWTGESTSCDHAFVWIRLELGFLEPEEARHVPGRPLDHLCGERGAGFYHLNTQCFHPIRQTQNPKARNVDSVSSGQAMT